MSTTYIVFNLNFWFNFLIKKKKVTFFKYYFKQELETEPQNILNYILTLVPLYIIQFFLSRNRYYLNAKKFSLQFLLIFHFIFWTILKLINNNFTIWNNIGENKVKIIYTSVMVFHNNIKSFPILILIVVNIWYFIKNAIQNLYL